MFDKILIANRGEIACRVIRTARAMGIGTVAIYSDADADALHVRQADESFRVGPPPSAESYLNADAIVEAAHAAGAKALHPGFGFLSENTGFAERLATEGIVFIGPPPAAIAAMGDKIESKRIAKAAGVNTIPGHADTLGDADEAFEVARTIGFPVMLKASAGGGGKGMRVVHDEDGVRDAFASAASEAKSSFGDDRVFVEKFIERPRHIEIQVLADSHGNIVHLGERECSIQRRHQKVIEEAPSPFIDARTREAMGAQAVALARSVDYVSAGTVEFVVDPQRNFYFLEMNTRLQVEHPVTEYITGLDLVEQMIRIATGERLPFGQEDISFDGWALEARVYAEDPDRNFLPSTGRLVHYSPPQETEHLRIDTGITEGSEISIFYDPMVAKLVTAGADRKEAMGRMQDALDAYRIRGVASNVPFLSAVVRHERFVAGDLSTAFIDEEFPTGFDAAQVAYDSPAVLVAAATTIHDICETSSAGARDYVVLNGAQEHTASIEGKPGNAKVNVNGAQLGVQTDWAPGDGFFRGRVGDEKVCVQVDREGLRWRLTHRGHVATFWVLRPRAAELNRLMPAKKVADLSKFLLSPMPGLLVRVCVQVGELVKPGLELAVVEAMKMENTLRAEREATVAAVLSSPGDSLSVDQPIIEFE